MRRRHSCSFVALVVAGHVHYEAAEECRVTQGALVRFLVREGTSSTDAGAFLTAVLADLRHQFWPDDLGFDRVDLRAVVGHRQVTDAYLAALARVRGARLATFDRGLVAVHPDVAELVTS